LIKEMFRVNNIIEEEIAQAKHKYNSKINFLHLHTRNDFASRAITTSMIKCIYRFNYHRGREKTINKNILTSKCPRCSKIKM